MERNDWWCERAGLTITRALVFGQYIALSEIPDHDERIRGHACKVEAGSYEQGSWKEAEYEVVESVGNRMLWIENLP